MSKSDPDPQCQHDDEHARRVSNLRDGEEYRGRSLRSVWVCDRRPCVLDAMAWVERANDGTAVIYDTSRQEVTL